MKRIFAKLSLLCLILLLSLTPFIGHNLGAYAHKDDFSYKSYGKRYDYVDSNLSPIDKTIASSKDMKAASHLIEVMQNNYAKADYLAYASVGSGKATADLMNMAGELKYGMIYIREKDASYFQSAAMITNATASGNINLHKLAQSALNQGERKYSKDGKTFYIEKVKGNKAKSNIIQNYPFSSAAYGAGNHYVLSHGQYKNKEFVKSDVNEFTNMVFSADTIKKDSIKINYANGLYTLSFEVDLHDKAKRNLATSYARNSLRALSDSDDLEFNVFKVNFEIWDNGLIRKYTREESWTGTLNLPLGLKPKGTSHSLCSIYYSFNPADCSIKNNGIDVSWAK